jgi:hypothetical protein
MALLNVLALRSMRSEPCAGGIRATERVAKERNQNKALEAITVLSAAVVCT